MRIVCPVCDGEEDLKGPPAHDLKDGCVRLERVTCPTCGVTRSIFMQYPHEGEAGEPA